MREENIRFVALFEGLAHHEKAYFRREMQLKCGVSKVTVYQWLKGEVRIKDPYKRVINALAGRRLFEVADVAPAFSV